jgi:adenylate kinase
LVAQGISGVGKSHILRTLKGDLDEHEWLLFEGAEEILKLTKGDLQQFKQLDESAKATIRGQAIVEIQKQCVAAGKRGIVAGHYMFHSTTPGESSVVWTEQESRTFTHMIYLEGHPSTVWTRRRDDVSRSRPELSLEELRVWQESEKRELRRTCYANRIYFVNVKHDKAMIISEYIQNFLFRIQEYDAIDNTNRVQYRLDDIMRRRQSPARTMLVFDADRTLSASDAGKLIWEDHPKVDDRSPLDQIVASELKYSYKAFCQADLLYHETFGIHVDYIYDRVASRVTLYPEMLQLLRQVSSKEHSGAVVVTCSPQLVWEKILSQHGLSNIPVIYFSHSGGRRRQSDGGRPFARGIRSSSHSLW